MKNITLTYDESKIRKKIKISKETDAETGDIIVTTRTIVVLPCIINSERLNKELDEFGFTSIPDCVKNILNRHGFRYDYKNNGWTSHANGVAVHVSRIKEDGTKVEVDEYSEEWGYNVALTKAKCKMQSKACTAMNELAGLFGIVEEFFSESAKHYFETYLVEKESLDRASKTGYCDIKMN